MNDAKIKMLFNIGRVVIRRTKINCLKIPRSCVNIARKLFVLDPEMVGTVTVVYFLQLT